MLWSSHTVLAAVIVAGFNESKDLIEYRGRKMLGDGIKVLMPYANLYERIKFGKAYTSVSAIRGMENTDTGIMVVHSKNDTTVPVQYGYDKFYEKFGNSARFTFVSYEDNGHDFLFYSDAAWTYREQINTEYKRYVEENGGVPDAEGKEKYMKEHLDKKQCFEPDPVLMEQITDMYDACCQK